MTRPPDPICAIVLMTLMIAPVARGDGGVYVVYHPGYWAYAGHYQKAFAAWSDAMDNDIVTMTFAEVPPWTPPSDHYNAIGVWFTDGYDQVVVQGNYLNDTVGVSATWRSSWNSTHLSMAGSRCTPQGRRCSVVLRRESAAVPDVPAQSAGDRARSGRAKLVGLSHGRSVDRVRLRRDGWGISVDDIHLQRVIDPVPADVNGDGVVDFMDLLLVLAWFGPCPSQDLLPGCAAADLDGNGVVDLADIVAVIYTWTG
ncbi:MAG: hypothetical protein KF817_13915 [Phycisphaeraceae bacterium]|nr:hypothetical protein [Phycisphaeraceae bacterium]